MNNKLTGRLIVIALIVAGVAGGAYAIWDSSIKDHVIPKRFGEVVPDTLYRSGELSTRLMEQTLLEHGIDVVINFTHFDPHDPEQLLEAELVHEHNMSIRYLPLDGKGTHTDPEKGIDAYVQALTEIHFAKMRNEQVLVHCSAGINRTGGAVALYRLLVERKPMDEVYAEMRSYDFNTDDNDRLLPFLNAHIDAIAAELKARGVIDSVPSPMPRFPVDA